MCMTSQIIRCSKRANSLFFLGSSKRNKKQLNTFNSKLLGEKGMAWQPVLLVLLHQLPNSLITKLFYFIDFIDRIAVS